MNNKSTWSLVLSVIAIVLCVLVFLLWIFEVIPHSVILPETFIGVIVALLAIIVTIAIGWQIFNIVEVKSIMVEYVRKQEEVNALQQQLKKEIKRLEMESDYSKHHSMHLHAITLALHCELKGKLDEACYHCFEALAESMQMREPMNEDNILDMIQKYSKELKGAITLSALSKNQLKIMDDLIRSSKHYARIAEKYENVHAQYINKIANSTDNKKIQ